MEHRIELADADERWRERYGVTHRSILVYQVKSSYSPTHVEVWSNADRPNPHPGEVKWNAGGRIGGDGRYLDPHNQGTDEEATVLLSPESTIISAHGDGTGTAASGQVWAADHEPLAAGDVLVLVYPDGREERRSVELTDNYGSGRALLCPDPQ